MKTDIIDSLAKLRKLDSKDIVKGFYELFEQINQMSSNEIVAAKQAVDLALELSPALVNKEDEQQLLHIIKAMHTRALFLMRTKIGHADCMRLKASFCVTNYDDSLSFCYDPIAKKIKPYYVMKKIQDTPHKKFWFNFLNRPTNHNPLDV